MSEYLEPDTTDGSSDYGESLLSETTTLTSSIVDYTYQNGRRYQRYFEKDSGREMPNDETEQDRLDLTHHMSLLVADGELHVAPVKNAHRVLDCGTGTGIWALDYAELHRETAVVGVDISPIQPAWTVTNCSFQIDDLELEWTFAGKFDFIHSRGMQMAVKDWDRYVDQVYKNLTPGGWVELSEYGFIAKSDSPSYQNSKTKLYFDTFGRAINAMGMTPLTPQRLEEALTKRGFTEVQIIEKKFPIGPWPKDKHKKQLGLLAGMSASTGFEAHALAPFTALLGMSPEEAKKICKEAAEELMKDWKVQAYNVWFYVIGRRPVE